MKEVHRKGWGKWWWGLGSGKGLV